MVKRGFGINLLAILAACVLAGALLQPWWILEFGSSGPSRIYPYTMRGPIVELVGYRRTSQMVTASYALAASAALILVGSLLRGWKGRLPLAVAGSLILLMVWRFLVRIKDMASRFDMPIQGHGIAQTEGGLGSLELTAVLGTGLYLAVGAGALCLFAALLHNWVRLPRK